MADDYSNISNPYNDSLAREPGGLSFATGGNNTDSGVAQQSQTAAQAGGNTAASSSSGGGPAQQASVASGGAMADITIENSIQSKNWSPKTVGFMINGQTGYAEFTNVYVSGNIQALTGSIGGWTINATTITGGSATLDSTGVITLGTANDVVIASAVDATYRLWAGNATAASAPFSVSKTGAIYATSGTIGGNSLSSTTISSTTFVSGPLGSGWQISNTGTAEFQNVTIRGTIRTSVFEKDTISAVNGMVLVTNSDILATDMTALDSSTITISGQTTFSENEVIRMKDGTDDEWMIVTNSNSAPTYTVTRDLAGGYSSNNNPIWKKGTAVVSMGTGTGVSQVGGLTLSVYELVAVGDYWDNQTPLQLHPVEYVVVTEPTLGLQGSGGVITLDSVSSTPTGFVLLDSSSSNSPYIDVYGRNSNTYSDYTLHGRFGWLKGITDSTVGLSNTDIWGLYTDNAYIKGTVVASSGTIGGWTIGATSLTSGSGSATVGLDTSITGGDDIRIYAGGATPSSAPFRVTESGVLTVSSAIITGRISSINSSITTCFESSTRFDVSYLVGTGAIAFNSDGASFASGTTNPSSAAMTWFPMPTNVFEGSPVFAVSVYLIGGGATSIVFSGLGDMTASTLDMTVDHAGFKFVGGDLYATQADGTTETAVLLHDGFTNSIYNLVMKVNGTTSVDYYWRLYRNNVGVYSDTWSSATTLTTNMPDAVNGTVTFRVDNQATTGNSRAVWAGATYTV